DTDAIFSVYDKAFNKNQSFKKSNISSEKFSLSWKKTKGNDNKTLSYILNNGTRVFIKPQRETPVIQLDMAFLGGEKIDPSNGISSLLAQRVWARETEKLSEEELVLEFDSMASSHTAFSGKH